MAKLGEQRTCTFSDIKKSFRIPFAEGNNLMYINVGDNSVAKAQDMKLINSWTITHPHSFTSPVVFNPYHEFLYCIQDNETLIKWSPDDDSLKKAPKIKFQESVFAVFIVPDGSLLILFNSCKIVQVIDSASIPDPLELTAWHPDEKLVWAEIAYSDNVLQIFCLGYFQKSQKYKLHCFKVSVDNIITTTFEQDIFHRDFILKSWCFNKFDSTFFTLWSDGEIVRHETFKSSHSELFSISDVQKSHCISMHMIDEYHIAIAKAIPKDKDCIVELWDFKFSACKVKKTVISSSPIDHIQMAVVDSSVLLLLNEDLISLPLHLEKATLASVLGVRAHDSSKIVECSWNDNGQVHILSEVNEGHVIENMEVDSENVGEKSEASLESIVKKFSEEGSKYFKYIPDAELVSLLRLAVRCKVTLSEKKSSVKNADIVLNAVLSSSFSDVFMMNLLKKLNCDETLAILQILLSFLKNSEDCTVDVESKPSDFQIFSWTCLVIQSHMETLLFSKDRKIIMLLKELNNCLTEKMEEYEDFEKIRSFLLLNKESFPRDHVRKKYSIDDLE